MTTAEFTVEPFEAGAPGPHVTAAIDAARVEGVTVQVGPFGTTLTGDGDRVVDAVGAAVRAALAGGATTVSVQVHRGDGPGRT